MKRTSEGGREKDRGDEGMEGFLWTVLVDLSMRRIETELTPGVLTSTSEAGDIICRRVLENIIRAWCTHPLVLHPLPHSIPLFLSVPLGVSRAGYFNRTRARREYLQRKRVLPNYPQCRLLLIELSIPALPVAPTGILDFRRISMRDASQRRRRRRGLLSHSDELCRASY